MRGTQSTKIGSNFVTYISQKRLNVKQIHHGGWYVPVVDDVEDDDLQPGQGSPAHNRYQLQHSLN